MKTAICISGLPRGYNITFDNIIKKLGNNNCDIFIHTWDIDNDNKRFTNAPIIPHDKFKYFSAHSNVKDIEITEFASNWNFLNVPTIANIVPLFYSIWCANQLKVKYEDTHNFKYDIGIRSRFDSYYENELPLHEIEQAKSDPNLVYIGLNAHNKGSFSARQLFKSEYTRNTFVADNFAFGSTRALNVYSNLYTKLRDVFTHTIVPEECLGYYLDTNNMLYKWTDYRYKSLVCWQPNNIVFESDYEDKQTVHFT